MIELFRVISSWGLYDDRSKVVPLLLFFFVLYIGYQNCARCVLSVFVLNIFFCQLYVVIVAFLG